MYWIDSADSNPCVGTGTAITWKLTAKGRKGHSGLPFDAVNPLLMCYEALMVIMEKYHKKYAAHPDEDKYNFMSPSTMKPTMWEQPPGSINQIPGTASISGDIRMTPFYNAEDAMKDVEQWVKELNDDITSLPGRGPKYSYDLGEGKTRGTLSVEWLDEPYHGIACSMESAGFKALHEATAKVRGESKHYSITGSLPLVKELQDEGFDLQISGYGLSSVYHGIDEYCLVSGMKNGFDILTTAMFQLNDTVQ
jgi:acetylornithine deacetylase